MLLVRQFALKAVSATLFAVSAWSAMPAMAQITEAAAVKASTPEAFVKQITDEVLSSVKTDKAIQQGDLRQITALIDAKIMPHVNFTRMTAAAVGPAWRRATPEQRQRLQSEFKTLLIYTYAGASSQVQDHVIEYLPSRAKPTDTDVVVRTLVKAKGEPIQLNYRLEKAGQSWKVYDVNVLGAWLVQTHQSSFAQEINASGIDGLISKLNERNRQLIAKSGGK